MRGSVVKTVDSLSRRLVRCVEVLGDTTDGVTTLDGEDDLRRGVVENPAPIFSTLSERLDQFPSIDSMISYMKYDLVQRVLNMCRRLDQRGPLVESGTHTARTVPREETISMSLSEPPGRATTRSDPR